MKAKTSLLITVLRGAAVYAVSYGLYWWAASMIGSPQDFRALWAKSLTPLGVLAAAYYFNKTDQTPRKKTRKITKNEITNKEETQ